MIWNCDTGKKLVSSNKGKKKKEVEKYKKFLGYKFSY